ncbi:hypothetical protein L6V77_16960 [Myxococcota bacterium]|nr:hypothetical protein [Myxococcota bacterium]
MRKPISPFATAIAAFVTFTFAAALTGCGDADPEDRSQSGTGTVGIERRLEVADCAGDSHVVERYGLTRRDGALVHDLRVDGEPYTLVTSRTPEVDLIEVQREDAALALAEIGADDARVLTPDGRVFAAETGAGFPDGLHDSLSPIAGVLLRGDVLDALLDEGADGGPGIEVRRFALDNDNLGTCNGVTCASKDGNESCCCKEKCVRNDTTCYCTKATQAMTGSTGGIAPIFGVVLR